MEGASTGAATARWEVSGRLGLEGWREQRENKRFMERFTVSWGRVTEMFKNALW